MGRPLSTAPKPRLREENVGGRCGATPAICLEKMGLAPEHRIRLPSRNIAPRQRLLAPLDRKGDWPLPESVHRGCRRNDVPRKGLLHLHHRKVGLGRRAIRACPCFGYVLPSRAGRDSIGWKAQGFVILKFTGQALPSSERLFRHKSRRAGSLSTSAHKISAQMVRRKWSASTYLKEGSERHPRCRRQ